MRNRSDEKEIDFYDKVNTYVFAPSLVLKEK